MRIDILTLFPEVFEDYLATSILKRAQDKKFVKIKVHNLRNWATDKRKTVDDKPYGGGAGMILKVEPIYKALVSLQAKNKNQTPFIILTDPKGKIFNQKEAKKLSKKQWLIIICGHYEGVDERLTKFINQKYSIGNYILTGGELPALVITDATTRLIKGVIKEQSLKEESFAFDNNLEYPQYTRPEVFYPKKFSKGLKVPKVLLSGNHQKIEIWRKRHSKKLE
ncbi:MAG TPA: tRNA (guanosine(37)-N1)-methyltransferase TrmD [Candidatus Paceibacterota bacterium]|jgi:tRNA (guanine37-N1)-methyltransferase|nr:tRNA (guanosine(37)-N1)-methyltransferase TrmD [Candidatus Paceibacterota bacterium]